MAELHLFQLKGGMTMKRYILCLVSFSVLCLLAIGCFTGGFLLKDMNETIFLYLIISACLSFLGAIIVITLNFKYLRGIETKKALKKLTSADYTAYTADIDLNSIRSNFLAEGFSEIARDNFLKKTYENCGDGNILTFTHIILRQIDGLADIDSLLQECRLVKNSLLNFPVYILIIQNRFDENAKILRDYTTAALAYAKVHPLSVKQCFYPILVHNGQVYCIQANAYTRNFKEAIHLSLKSLKISN